MPGIKLDVSDCSCIFLKKFQAHIEVLSFPVDFPTDNYDDSDNFDDSDNSDDSHHTTHSRDSDNSG